MSDFIAAEWLTPGPGMGVGAVLIYDQHDGFKCYMGAQDASRHLFPDEPRDDSDQEWDITRIRKMGAKVPVEMAVALFKVTMINEWQRRNFWDKVGREFRYDGHDYYVGTGPREAGK